MHKNYFCENSIVHVRQGDGTYIERKKSKNIKALLYSENAIELYEEALMQVREKINETKENIVNIRKKVWCCLFFALIVEIWDFLLISFKSGYGLDIMEMIQFFSKPLFVNGAIVTFIFGGLILKEVYNLKKERKSNRILTKLKRHIEKDLVKEKSKHKELVTSDYISLNQDMDFNKTLEDELKINFWKERMQAYYKYLLYQKAYLKQLKAEKGSFFQELYENPSSMETLIITEALRNDYGLNRKVSK